MTKPNTSISKDENKSGIRDLIARKIRGDDTSMYESTIPVGDGYTEDDIPDDERGTHPMNEGLRQRLLKMEYMIEGKRKEK